MNAIHKTYSLILDYLVHEPEDDTAARRGIVAQAAEAGASWVATDESIEMLERCVNRGSTVTDEDEWSEIREEFVLAAFRDLSPMKNPLAMETFRKLQEKCLFEIGEHLVWARKVNRRDDGSAVIVLHVSDLSLFEKLVGGGVTGGTLEEGVMIGL